jgi:hypothetical protein
MHRHEQRLVMLKIAMGGIVSPSAAQAERRRAALLCLRTVLPKNRARDGREMLTRTNSD